MRKGYVKWWQIALVSIVLSFLGSLSSGRKNKEERRLYEVELDQAPWAPPGWLFGPAWITVNFFLLYGLFRLWKQKHQPFYHKLLLMQLFIWIIFFSFGYIYFNQKSPVLAAVWTVGDALLAGSSFVMARKRDKKLAFAYLPLLLWTSYAGTVAVYQAVNNPDPLITLEKSR